MKRFSLQILTIIGVLMVMAGYAWAQTAPLQPPAGPMDPFSLPRVEMAVGGENGDWVGILRILALLTVLTVAPAILLTMTSFTRIIIVFSFLRQALGTQQSPPNQVMIALALFLTIFIMEPVWSKVHSESLEPYMAGEISQSVAMTKHLDLFGRLYRTYRQKDLALFVKISNSDRPTKRSEVSTFQLLLMFVYERRLPFIWALCLCPVLGDGYGCRMILMAMV